MTMRWRLLLACMLVGLAMAQEADDSTPDAAIEEEDEVALDEEESRNLRPRAYTPSAFAANNLPSGFRPSPEIQNLEATLAPQRRPLQPLEQESYINLVPVRPQQQQQLYEEQPRQQQRLPHRKHQDQRPPANQQELEEELEEEKEEPDRLSLLLQQSKFDCVSRQTGYYADEELACEVFHYCHDSVKHSWICPSGFTFHQVHLICMPPTGDNICQRSSKYHFVNEYLYRPINEEEHQRKPNVTLKYSDRYYPSDIYRDDRYEDEEEDDEQHAEAPRRAPAPPPQRQAPRQQAQVFRTAEEVNIPLLQRRPQARPYLPSTTSDFEYQ